MKEVVKFCSGITETQKKIYVPVSVAKASENVVFTFRRLSVNMHVER